MDATTPSDAPLYRLTERGFHSLQEMRDLLFLMASMTYAATLEEEKVLLQIPRSILGKSFEIIATQLAEVLDVSKRTRPLMESLWHTH